MLHSSDRWQTDLEIFGDCISKTQCVQIVLRLCLSHILFSSRIILLFVERWRKVILQLFTLLLLENFACEENGIFLFLLLRNEYPQRPCTPNPSDDDQLKQPLGIVTRTRTKFPPKKSTCANSPHEGAEVASIDSKLAKIKQKASDAGQSFNGPQFSCRHV